VISYQPGQSPLSAGFTERPLEIIDSGRRSAAYKLALLLALLDLCVRYIVFSMIAAHEAVRGSSDRRRTLRPVGWPGL
jgi:hypothetical protein